MLYKVVFVVLGILFHISDSSSVLEPVYDHCCKLGSSEAQKYATCAGFPVPITGIPSVFQAICLIAVEICCVRIHRITNCKNGKDAAKLGQGCVIVPVVGGEAHKDCCEGCKLGLAAAKTNNECKFKNFSFGTPWDESYYDCCIQALDNSIDNTNKITNPDGQDINECALFPNQLCAHICINTHGSYRCECNPGFVLHSNGKSCVQESSNNKCDTNNPCEHICVDTGTAIQCECHAGFHLLPDGQNCADIDECAHRTDTCKRNIEICQNTVGGFECVEINSGNSASNCYLGYYLNQETNTCDDIDECTLGSDNCNRQTQICSNTIGSYTCIPHTFENCPVGFRKDLNSAGCLDIDECAEGLDACNRNEEICVNTYGKYQCEPKKTQNCPAGFKFNDNKECEDIDECTEGTHNCNTETETCFNIPSSFHCIVRSECGNGYQKNSFTNQCEDINECAIGTHDCNLETHYCVNIIGSYQCQTKTSITSYCERGYVADPTTRTCVDINECNDGNRCLSNQKCENTLGSFRCICLEGYQMDPTTKTCNDINECLLGYHNCLTTQRCDNTIGSFICVRIISCGTGYTINAETRECEDDDECRLGTHNCGPSFVCRNTEGSFRCDRIRCPPGQKLLSDGTCQTITCSRGMESDSNGNCIDINECVNPGICRPNQRCINTVGSYRCQNLLTCGGGYEVNEYGNQCVDIDECSRGTHECGAKQICRNRAGGYICECPTGYLMNAKRECEDIDECVRFHGQVCSVNSECQNTIGSYICNCKTGFRQGENARNCLDIDECSETPNLCHQKCINVWGSYQCTCEQGYSLESDNRTCKDIDECKLYEGRRKLCMGLCLNEPGSYSCACPDGYRLSGDKRTCQDINECEEQGVCRGENEVCLNVRGGYRCNAIICPPNYIRDPDHRNRCKRAVVNCRQGDAECLKAPLSYSFNFITLVSNMQIPVSGQLDLFTMRGPRFSFTSVQFALELKSARAPEGINPASREYFQIRRTAFNEVMLSIARSIPGPQDIELELIMKMYHNGLFGGTAIAKILIFVTRYEY